MGTLVTPTPYTLEQVEEQLSALRGDVDRLNEIITMNDQGSVVPNAPVPITGSPGAHTMYDQNGQPSWISDTALQMGVVGAQQAWLPNLTASGTALGNLAQWQIPPGDAEQFALYSTEVWGTGETGTANATLQFAVVLGGNAMATTTLAAVFFNTASFSFTWHYEAFVILTSAPGSGATWKSAIKGEVSALALVDPGSGNQNTAGSCGVDSGTTTVDSTVGENLSLSAKWGAAATGSQGVTSQFAIAKRWC